MFAIASTVRDRNRAIAARQLASARAFLNDGVLRTVILGDSVARGAGDERGRGIAGALDMELRTRNVRATAVMNVGIDGARTFHVVKALAERSRRSMIRAADVVVLSIGGNDLYGDSAARLLAAIVPDCHQQRTIARVRRVVDRIRELNPAARIYLLGLYNPYRATWLDAQVNRWDARLITEFAAERDVTVLRICDLFARGQRISSVDHFHPGVRGYEAIAMRIATAL